MNLYASLNDILLQGIPFGLCKVLTHESNESLNQTNVNLKRISKLLLKMRH